MLGRACFFLFLFCGGGGGRSNPQPYTCSKVVSPRNQAKHLNEYTLEERAKVGRYGAENGSSKVMKHFPLLLEDILTCNML